MIDRRQPLPHGQAHCPRCDGDPNCGFCDGSGVVLDASCWTTDHPEHHEPPRKDPDDDAHVCDAAIRPFPTINPDVTLRCELHAGHPERHDATLRDYAYPGSETHLLWSEGDRRTFHGDWPGACDVQIECPLPLGHRGGCVS